MLFTEFLDTIYTPVCLPKLANSTQNRSRGVIANYLQPRFGEARIAAITVLDVDRFLSTTLDIYQQFVPASQRRVIDTLLDHFAIDAAP